LFAPIAPHLAQSYNFKFRQCLSSALSELPLANNESIQANPNTESISIRRARVHNLKDVSVEIPHNAITVVTALTGSGKSSLGFDTIHAEGQRRYVESLSAYARQFLERMEKPDVDEISGIAPAVAIRQKNSTRNPRSTVATATEIYDYLRLLFARCGETFCIHCGSLVRRDSPDEIATRVLTLPAGRRFYVLYRLRLAQPPSSGQTSGSLRKLLKKKAPAAPPQDGLRNALLEMQKRGFNRLDPDGPPHEISFPEALPDLRFRNAGVGGRRSPSRQPGVALAPGRLDRNLLSRGRW